MRELLVIAGYNPSVTEFDKAVQDWRKNRRRWPPKYLRLPYALGWIALWAIALSLYSLFRKH